MIWMPITEEQIYLQNHQIPSLSLVLVVNHNRITTTHIWTASMDITGELIM